MTAEWVAAIGQVAGALATTAAVLVALRIARRDQRLRDEKIADRSAAQARLITLRTDLKTDKNPDYPIDVCVQNDSGKPIYKVAVVKVRDVDNPELNLSWQERSRNREGSASPADVVNVGGYVHFYGHLVDEEGNRYWPDSAPVLSRQFSLSIQFLDQRGLCWNRCDTEPPVRVISSGDIMPESMRESGRRLRRENRWWKPERQKPTLSWSGRHILTIRSYWTKDRSRQRDDLPG